MSIPFSYSVNISTLTSVFGITNLYYKSCINQSSRSDMAAAQILGMVFEITRKKNTLERLNLRQCFRPI